LDLTDFAGTSPNMILPGLDPPVWSLTSTSIITQSFPSQNTDYMSAILNRRFINPPFINDLVVMKMRSPTFADTQNGVPPYTNTEVRSWSVCTNDPISSGVARCIADNQAKIVNGFVTFVISDPSKRPSASVLEKWGAVWLAWGALEPGDSVYDPKGGVLTNADGVFYYNNLLYRQTFPSATFIHSIDYASRVPRQQAPGAMGEYWPQLGYCKALSFQTFGPSCIGGVGQ
jgi:hypothetical protein